jgi:hypothetical protein
MRNSHLISVLSTLTKKETRDLKKWLASPIHNQRDDVLLLFGYLMAGNHLYEEKYLQKERIFSKLFPGEPFNDARLRQTQHFLLKSVEEFLIYQELREDQVRSKLALATVYRKRKLEKGFQKTMKSAESEQEEFPHRNEAFFHNAYLLHQEKYYFQSEKQRMIETNLQDVSDSLDIMFLVDKLRQACLMIAHQKVFKTEFEIGLLDEVLAYVERQNVLDTPAIATYYYAYKTSVEQDQPEYFEALKLQLKSNIHFFPPNEQRDIYLFAINYCIGRLNLGDRQLLRDLFELFRDGIEQKILIENNTLNRFTFRNIVNLGTTLKEFDWIENFIQNYQQYLLPKYRENFVHFSYAKLHYEKRDYNEAMRLLSQFDYDDVLINMSAKSMLIKMYYEQEEIDTLESLLESMRNYIHRKKIIGYHKSIYSNLIRYTRRLVRVNPFDKEQRKKLQAEIEAANPLPERTWLLEQLENL